MAASGKPCVSAVLGTYNRLPFLRQTIDTLRRDVETVAHEIIVVDGGSTDGTIRWLARQKDIVTIVQHNRGEWRGRALARRSWGYFMNLGFRCSAGKYVLMLSDDCLVVPGAVPNGIDRFERLLASGRRVAGLAFYFRDNPVAGNTYYVSTTFDRLFVNHGLFLRSAVSEVGYFDEDRYAFYHADTDLCLRLWRGGHEIGDSPESYVEHFAHVTRHVRRSNEEGEPESLRNFLNAWEGIYYDRANPRLGGKVERTHSDRTRTLERYLRRLPLGFRLRYRRFR